jgi:uncharacterized membrane protein YhhN
MVPVYFAFPQYLIKASPVWFCSLSCILHNREKYTIFVAIGLLFGSLGDILLETKASYGVDLFVPGLIAFLIGHLFYIRAFFVFPPEASAVYFAGPICGAYYATIMSVLLPNVSIFLIAPIAIYGCVITAMAFLGINRFLRWEKIPIWSRLLCLFGSLFFVSSDTMLSINLYESVPNSNKLIMTTYYLGQLLIAASAQFPLSMDGDELLSSDSLASAQNLLYDT